MAGRSPLATATHNCITVTAIGGAQEKNAIIGRVELIGHSSPIIFAYSSSRGDTRIRQNNILNASNAVERASWVPIYRCNRLTIANAAAIRLRLAKWTYETSHNSSLDAPKTAVDVHLARQQQELLYEALREVGFKLVIFP